MVVQARMQTLAIIPDLDIVEQRPTHLLVAAAAGVSGQLGFEGLKETLGWGGTGQFPLRDIDWVTCSASSSSVKSAQAYWLPRSE